MTRVREEAAAVGEHAGEVGEQALLGEHRELLLHAAERVVEPPGVTELHALLDAALEGAAQARERQPVGVVEAVDDDLGQLAGQLGRIEEGFELEGEIGLGTHRVEAGVLADELEVAGGVVAEAVAVNLHGPTVLLVLAHEEERHGRLVLADLLGRDILAGETLGNDRGGLILGRRVEEELVGAVVRQASTHTVEVVDALGRSGLEGLVVFDIDAGNIAQGLGVVGEGRQVDAEQIVGTEGGQDLEAVLLLLGGQELMPLKVARGVVSRADALDVELLDQTLGRELRFGDLLVGSIPNGLGVLLVEGEIDAEDATELGMAPLEDGVAGRGLDGLHELEVLGIRIAVAGDVLLIGAVGAKQTPLVVIARAVVVEPDLGEVLEVLVLVDLLRIEVAVVVDDRHLLRMIVEEPLGPVRRQQKVIVQQHGLLLLLIECFPQTVDVGDAQGAVEQTVARTARLAPDHAAMIGTDKPGEAVVVQRLHDAVHVE